MVLECFHLEHLVAEADLGPQAAPRGERDHFVGGKGPLGEDVQHLAADIARGTNHRDPVTHCKLSESFRS